MKTQTTKNAFKADKRYTGVYQQQGRMITDADWNEQTDIEQQQLTNALTSTVNSGIPAVHGLQINTDLSIQPGTVFVDGLQAELIADDKIELIAQADFPAGLTFNPNNKVLYADVWDRNVTALEDIELMDPALHGADTTTRTQRMLQIKWCDATLDPENPDHNPGKGNAELSLRLRKAFAGENECDPCAKETDLDKRVGNYLFRVEVHSLITQDGDDILTLKWSRENGAEVYPYDNSPPAFRQGNFVWEFFTTDSEKLMGVQLASGFVPQSESLRHPFEETTADENKFVRQWDGFIEYNLTTNQLISGRDKNATLDDELSSTAHGKFTVAPDVLSINGEILEIHLRHQDRKFVVGDYWTVAVREALHEPGDWVLGAETEGETPQGIEHHYLTLATTDGTGSLTTYTDAQRRKFNFPPLTNIQAKDVGFANECTDLYGTAENVQQALTALCDLSSEHVDYTVPGCSTSIASELRAKLGNFPDADNDGKVTVKDMLDTLLCQVNANHIPFLASESSCPTLADDSVTTVQEALEALCEKPAESGCAITVPPGDDLLKHLTTFAASDQKDIWLCLQPGIHNLQKIEISDKNSIKIIGSGKSASSIEVADGTISISADEVHIDDCKFDFKDGEAQLDITSYYLSATHNDFSRRQTRSEINIAMVHWTPTGSANQSSIYWLNNRMSSGWLRRIFSVTDLIAIDPATADITGRLDAELDKLEFYDDPKKLEEIFEKFSTEIDGLPPRTKESMFDAYKSRSEELDFTRDSQTSIGEVVIPMRLRALPARLTVAGPLDALELPVAIDAPSRATRPSSDAIRTETPVFMPAMVTMADESSIVARAVSNEDIRRDALTTIGNLVSGNRDLTIAAGWDFMDVTYESGHNPVLSIANQNHGGTLSSNLFNGHLMLELGNTDPQWLTSKKATDISFSGRFVTPSSGILNIENNDVRTIKSAHHEDAIGDNTLIRRTQGYSHISLTNNMFRESESSFIASSLSINGIKFFSSKGEEQYATLLCNQCIVSNALGTIDLDGNAEIKIIIDNRGQAVTVANLTGFEFLHN